MRFNRQTILIAGAVVAVLGSVLVYLLFFSDEPEVQTDHLAPIGDLGTESESSDETRILPYRELIAASHHPFFSGPRDAFAPTSRPDFPEPAHGMDTNYILAELEKEFAELEEQLRQKRKRLIVTLADDAIGNGHRNSFARLERLAAEFRNDEELAKEIRTQVLRVDSYFFRSRGSRTAPLPIGELFPEVESEDKLTIGDLLTVLVSPNQFNPHQRCRAAYLLGLEKPGLHPKVPGYLLHAAKRDPDLSVVDESLHSFEKLTGVDSTRIFDWSPAAVWWNLNNPDRNVSGNP